MSLDHDHPVRPHDVLWPRKSRLPLKQTPTRLARELENVHTLNALIKFTRRQKLARHIVANYVKRRMTSKRDRHTARSVREKNTFLHLLCQNPQKARELAPQRHVLQQDRLQDMIEPRL